jgi:hypothetical protein
LLLLATHCDAVMLALLNLSGREHAALALDLVAIEADLAVALALVRRLRGERSPGEK